MASVTSRPAGRQSRGRGLPVTLMERERELESIRHLLDDARRGHGGLVLIVGEPGIGKTRLVEEARCHAAEAGLRVLATRGAPLEREYAYGVVRQFFEPAVAAAAPAERASLFEGAAALAERVFDAAPAVGAAELVDEGFATQHGLYWLAANLARGGPLALLVDDLHWADAASLRWIDYLARRLEGLPILLLAALRCPEEGDHPELVSQLLAEPEAVVLRPGGLGLTSVEALIREILGVEPEDEFSAACLDATRGNPLYLRSLLDTLAADDVAPLASAASRVFAVGPEAVARSVDLRLARLPQNVARLAQAVAVLGDGCRLRDAATLSGLDLDSGAAAVARLVEAGILARSTALEYAHPVVRTVVYDRIDLDRRHAAHRAAAALLAAEGANAEQSAAHVLALPRAGDAFAVKLLRTAARCALGRGAADAAVSYLRRALDEHPSGPQRAALLLELGRAELKTDVARGVEDLREAAHAVDDPEQRLDALVGYGRGLLLLSRQREAAEAFASAGGLVPADSDARALIDAMYIQASLFEPSIFAAGAARAEALLGEAHGDGVGGSALAALLAYFETCRGGSLERSVSLARRALASGALSASRENLIALFAVFALIAAGRTDEARTAFDAAIEAARRRGDVVSVGGFLVFRGYLFAQVGDLLHAEADLRSANGNSSPTATTLTLYRQGFLGDVLVDRGRIEEAGAVVGHAAEHAARAQSVFLLRTHARLHLAEGRPRDAASTLEEIGRTLSALGTLNPSFLPWRSDLSRALALLGRWDEARDWALAELELARRWGAPRAVGAALRALAEASEQDREELLREAVGVLEGTSARLEQARALVELGSCLRREHGGEESRTLLRRGLALADESGCRPLAERAQTELTAAGAPLPTARRAEAEVLTAAERRVAALAAGALNDREIAQALFVTVPTVEVALSSAFRKLGVASRAQLARALGESGRTLSDIVRGLAHGRSWNEVAAWPPDAFAVTSTALADSGAYRLVVSPPPGRHWPDYGAAPEENGPWAYDVRRWGSEWAARAAGSHPGASGPPAAVAHWWSFLQAASELPTTVFDQPDHWETLVALLNVHAIADEACSGLVHRARRGSAFHREALGLLTATGSLAQLPSTRVRVLPKLRLPDTGITIRSLSRHIAVDRSEVETRWLIPERAAAPRATDGRLTLLLVPHPSTVEPGDFRPVPGPLDNMDAEAYGFFEFEPHERLDPASIVRLVDAAQARAGAVDMVILPEAALAEQEVAPLQRALVDAGVRLLIAGVRRRASGDRLGASYAHVGGGHEGSVWNARPQYKHHRWCLEESQIAQYRLTSGLDPKRRWWEAIGVGKRTLTFVTLREDVTLCPLVCEDLARPDPVTEVVREVGPTLVVALLLDGPQLATRWPGRYASVLADDPGSSVLTLTSLGMAERSQPAGCAPSRTVALWRDAHGGLRELSLAEGASAILVTATTAPRREVTADGRRASVPARDLLFCESEQIDAGDVPPRDYLLAPAAASPAPTAMNPAPTATVSTASREAM